MVPGIAVSRAKPMQEGRHMRQWFRRSVRKLVLGIDMSAQTNNSTSDLLRKHQQQSSLSFFFIVIRACDVCGCVYLHFEGKTTGCNFTASEF